MTTKIDTVNINTYSLAAGFGSRVVEAYNAAYPDGTLSEPITFKTVEGDFQLSRIGNLNADRKQGTMVIIGGGAFASSPSINRDVRIDIELHGVTREGTIKSVSL